jgi:hypothetical protein
MTYPIFPVQPGTGFSRAPDKAAPVTPAVEPVATVGTRLRVVDVEVAFELVRAGSGVALIGVGSDQVAVC